MKLTGRALVAAMCAGQVGNLIPHVVVPAIMAQHLMGPWGLGAAKAGLMASSYSLGYMVAVPILTTLTDRIDARLILAAGSALSGAATIAFGLFADGLWSAMALWALAGIGFAGAYMPGLKALTDRLPPGDASRSVTLYTSSFSLGVGLSFLVSQLIADALGWRAAFMITGIAPVAMLATCAFLAPQAPPSTKAPLLDFRPVLKNRPAMGYILGYGAHCFELNGLRTWIVTFWIFVAVHGAATPIGPVAASVIVTLLSMPASILGNEAALRFGRVRALVVIMVASSLVALAIGLNAASAPWLLVGLFVAYAFTVTGDSGALTSGMAGAAEPQFRGVTMALHSAVGVGLSAVSGWAVGVAIDAGGGPMSAAGWTAGFAVLAAGVLMGPLALLWARATSRQSKQSASAT
jgi:predicted MFS family arabinose efflux permease